MRVSMRFRVTSVIIRVHQLLATNLLICHSANTGELDEFATTDPAGHRAQTTTTPTPSFYINVTEYVNISRANSTDLPQTDTSITTAQMLLPVAESSDSGLVSIATAANDATPLAGRQVPVHVTSKSSGHVANATNNGTEAETSSQNARSPVTDVIVSSSNSVPSNNGTTPPLMVKSRSQGATTAGVSWRNASWTTHVEHQTPPPNNTHEDISGSGDRLMNISSHVSSSYLTRSPLINSGEFCISEPDAVWRVDKGPSPLSNSLNGGRIL